MNPRASIISASTKIGVIDSGVGGLSILNNLVRLAPGYTFVYVADAAHLPYGQKTVAFLIERMTRITQFLESQDITTIFVACHTVSATALPFMQALFPHITYIDMVPCTVEKALATTRNKKIGIMATTATIASKLHRKFLDESGTDIHIYEQACPLFVPLIEAQASSQELDAAVSLYLKPLLTHEVDTIILGCTHYPFIQTKLEEQAPGVTFVSAANSFPAVVFGASNASATTVEFITTSCVEYLTTAVARYFISSATMTITYEARPELS